MFILILFFSILKISSIRDLEEKLDVKIQVQKKKGMIMLRGNEIYLDKATNEINEWLRELLHEENEKKQANLLAQQVGLTWFT